MSILELDVTVNDRMSNLSLVIRVSMFNLSSMVHTWRGITRLDGDLSGDYLHFTAVWWRLVDDVC